MANATRVWNMPELRNHIYEYDATVRDQFKLCIREMKLQARWKQGSRICKQILRNMTIGIDVGTESHHFNHLIQLAEEDGFVFDSITWIQPFTWDPWTGGEYFHEPKLHFGCCYTRQGVAGIEQKTFDIYTYNVYYEPLVQDFLYDYLDIFSTDQDDEYFDALGVEYSYDCDYDY